MRKLHCIFLVLALMTALFVSCSQDIVGSSVTDDLVSVSFATGSKSRALTVSREVFDEDDYIWCYTAVKADNSGMTQGETRVGEIIQEAYVWGDDHTRTGLTGAEISGLSQGLWDFTLRAYVPIYEGSVITGKSDVMAWFGSVTNQPVRKGEANVVNVTVSAVIDPGNNGTITFEEVVVRKLNDENVTAPEIWTGDKDLVLGVKARTLAGEAVADAFVSYYKGEGHTWQNIPAPKFELAAGSYLVTFKAYEGEFDAPTFTYAEETIAVNVYSGLKTIIGGYISELSSYVVFGEPVANAVIEASTPSVIEVTPQSEPISFVTDSTQSTSYKAASIPAVAVVNIKETIEASIPEGSTLTDLALSLNVEDKGSTDASEKTTKKFEISLDAVVTTTDESTGSVTVESSSVTGGIEDFMTVQLYIGKELADLKVYHHDVEIKKSGSQLTGAEYYEYDDTAVGDGILTLHVNSFSPFSVEYSKKVAVARLIKADGTGSDFYTLPEAIDAASDGDTIRLLSDLDFSQEPYSDYKWAGSTYHPLEITNNDITLDLNGKTIENMGNCALVFGHILAVDGRISNVTIKNGTLKAGKTSGVTNSYVLGIAGADGALIENVTTDGGINVYTLSQDVVIKNCTVNGTKYYTVCAQTGSEVTIEGDDGAFSKNTDSTVANKAMFWVDKAGKDSDVATPENPEGNHGASSITIKAGTFTIDTENGGVFYLSSGLKPVARGGIYNIDPSAYAPADCLVEEIEDGWYKVTPLTLVEAVDSSCTATGTHTYWTDGTAKYIIDIDAGTRSPVTDEELVIPVHEHALVYKSYTDKGDGTCNVTLECVRCGSEVIREGINLYVLSEPSESNGTTETTFKVNGGEERKGFYACLKLGGVIVLPIGDSNATYYIGNNADDINYNQNTGVFSDLYVIGCGQKISVLRTSSMGYKGLRIKNRHASMVENGLFTNVYFADITLGAWVNNLSFPLFITSYNVEAGFTNVTFGGAEGKSSLQLWLQQNYADRTAKDYPTRQDNAATYLNFKSCTVDDGYSFMFAFQGMWNDEEYSKQEAHGYTWPEKDYYASLHICADDSSIAALKLDGAGLSVSTAVHHDGVHNEWFLNGKILRGIAGSEGIYSVN